MACAFFPSFPYSSEDRLQMKTVCESLQCIIRDLDDVCNALESLRIRMEFGTPRVVVDEYYKILIAFDQTKKAIEALRSVAGEAKFVNPAT